jgi:hypothetical protein
VNLSLGLPTDDETYFRLNLRMPRNPGKSSTCSTAFLVPRTTTWRTRWPAYGPSLSAGRTTAPLSWVSDTDALSDTDAFQQQRFSQRVLQTGGFYRQRRGL